MTIKGRLLSSIAIIKLFRPKRPPVWQAPLPVNISQPYVLLENHSGGITTRKNLDDIFIRFDTIPSCDGQTRDDSNSRAYAWRRAGKSCKRLCSWWLCFLITYWTTLVNWYACTWRKSIHVASYDRFMCVIQWNYVCMARCLIPFSEDKAHVTFETMFYRAFIGLTFDNYNGIHPSTNAANVAE